MLTKARMFAHKPDGEVTWMALRDAQGNPAPVMQDPMHFPHGTGFLAPGLVHAPHPHIRANPAHPQQLKGHCNTDSLAMCLPTSFLLPGMFTPCRLGMQLCLLHELSGLPEGQCQKPHPSSASLL